MNFASDGTVIQRALIRDPKDHRTTNMSHPKLGVILNVRSADDPKNRSSREHEDRRGFIAEADVYLVNDCAILPNVFITPATPSGLDNFVELLPRPSTKSVKGGSIDANLTDTDPYDLDGDWCIVEFLDGNIQTPFISRYFPNPRNVYDSATSGQGNPVFSTGKGTSLKQQGRYFNRTNGVEWVINRNGDIWLSTARSGNTLLMGSPISIDGRFPRQSKSIGGNITVNVKPSKTIEFSFDEQVDGIGANGLADSSLPQRNPNPIPPMAIPQDNTTITWDKDKAVFMVPAAFVVNSLQKVLLDAGIDITLSANSKIVVESTNVEIDASVKVLADAPTIQLGSGAVDGASKATPTMENFATLVAAINAIITAVKIPTPVTLTPSPITVPVGAVTGLVPVPAPLPVTTTKVRVE